MKDDRVYLQHIRDAIDDIAGYTNAGRDLFFAERMRQDATLRKLEVIGQAVKNLSDSSKALQPEIPWKQIAGLRDKVIHDYFGVDLGHRVGRRREGAPKAATCDSRAPRGLTALPARVVLRLEHSRPSLTP